MGWGGRGKLEERWEGELWFECKIKFFKKIKKRKAKKKKKPHPKVVLGRLRA